ncbi:MAG: molybdopterin synthase sulfur carrier subunit [Candidatus Bathyarchaeia archaeon]
MQVTVSIPHALRQYTQDKSEVGLDASTVDELLLKLDGLFPGLRAFIVDEGKGVRRYVNIFVNEGSVNLTEGKAWRLMAQWLPPIYSVSTATIL